LSSLLSVELKMVTLYVPSINDCPGDFDNLFQLYKDIDKEGRHANITFDFSRCSFLRQNAVSFLGGLVCTIRERRGTASLNLDTLQRSIRANLAQNGFLAALGYDEQPWPGNSIPYRRDQDVNKQAQMDYLRRDWLGRGWVQINPDLSDEIAGRVWEIYCNAFEHGNSTVGVFSCGQYYPTLRKLKLTVVDFGIGIPANVRKHKREPSLPIIDTLEWAFYPGNSTKADEQDLARGIGLDLLKEFLKCHGGKLEIFSDTGYVSVDQTAESYTIRLNAFRGTIVNITIQCNESLL
jgi:hypothetical protein